MSYRNRLAGKYPLRKIVSGYTNQYNVVIERLECGHEQPRKHDIYGPTNASARRCRRCYAEALAAKQPSLPWPKEKP